eukprot:scaffold5619_cov211-Ochromonas_danica.AAC.1
MNWTEEAMESFKKLVNAISSCQKLFFMDEHAPIYLETDASDYGIGAYLYQLVDALDLYFTPGHTGPPLSTPSHHPGGPVWTGVDRCEPHRTTLVHTGPHRSPCATLPHFPFFRTIDFKFVADFPFPRELFELQQQMISSISMNE